MSDGGEDIEFGERFTETEYSSWGQRMQSSCAGICIGIILFVASTPLLFWNEGRAVKRQEDLDEGRGIVQQIGKLATNATIDKAKENSLIYVSGMLDAGNSTLFDPDFNLDITSAINALKYSRTSSMYQFQENEQTTTEKTSGGGSRTTTTYSYSAVWSSTLISSGNFRKQEYNVNPTSFPVSTFSDTADRIMVGPYVVGNTTLGDVDWWTTWNDVPLDASSIPDKSPQYTGSLENGNVMYRINSNSATTNPGTSTNSPNQIGDTIVSFEIVEPDEVSIVAKQENGYLKPYITEGDRELILFSRGYKTSDELFSIAEDENNTLTWILRFVGFIVMAIGICLFLNPLSVAFDVIPFCGNFIGDAIGGCIIPCIALSISVPFSLLVISIAWIFYRPLFAAVGIAMFIILCGVGYYIKKSLDQSNPNGNKPPQHQTSAAAPFGQPYGGEKPIEPSYGAPPSYGSQKNEEPAFGMALDRPAPPAAAYYGASAPPAPTTDGYSAP
jgi:hypothetical protein